MKKNYNIILLLIFIYVLYYRFSFAFFGDIIQYIINPLIWGIFALVVFLTLYHKANQEFKYKNDVLDISIISAILYVIIFHALGLIVGFAHNPYKIDIYWLVINSFSIIGVLFFKEYIRAILINIKGHNIIYYVFLFLLFLIVDLDLINIFHAFKNTIAVIDVLLKTILPIVMTNFLMFYLARKGGFLPPFIFQTIIVLPSIIFPIVPKNEWYVYTLFDLVFSLLTYLIIQYIIDKKQRELPTRLLRPFSFKKWLYTIAAICLVVMFGMGFFPIRPIVIMSESMEPNINPGDVLIIAKISINELKVGDVIEYKLKNFNIAHRIIRIDNVNNKKVLIVKGDKNSKPDPNPVDSSQIIGKSIIRIPLIGYPTYWIRKMLTDTSNINIGVGT